tara:strand:- start:388 stop:543 length:156 start_codon:yes stop_codon:yes gene_type:complete
MQTADVIPALTINKGFTKVLSSISMKGFYLLHKEQSSKRIIACLNIADFYI